MLHVYSIFKEPAHLDTQGTVLNNRESWRLATNFQLH